MQQFVTRDWSYNNQQFDTAGSIVFYFSSKIGCLICLLFDDKWLNIDLMEVYIYTNLSTMSFMKQYRYPWNHVESCEYILLFSCFRNVGVILHYTILFALRAKILINLRLVIYILLYIQGNCCTCRKCGGHDGELVWTLFNMTNTPFPTGKQIMFHAFIFHTESVYLFLVYRTIKFEQKFRLRFTYII